MPVLSQKVHVWQNDKRAPASVFEAGAGAFKKKKGEDCKGFGGINGFSS
jgi:hypothetical protein